MANVTITRGTTLPDTASKADFHNLVDTATGTTSNIVNADIDSAAGIVDTKLATISTSQKVNTSALVTTSQAQGDILYASSSTAWTRLGAGTSGYILKTQGAGANPAWVDYASYVTSANALSGSVVQVVNTLNTSMTTIATAIPYDDTIPQNTEGGSVMSRSITPTNASNKLLIRATVCWSNNTGATYNTLALFQDSTANALACTTLLYGASTNLPQISTLEYYMTAGTTSSTTFSLRLGDDGGNTITINGVNGARKYGGALTSSMTITEIKG